MIAPSDFNERLAGHSDYLKVPSRPEWHLVKLLYLDMSQRAASLVAG